MADPRSGVDEQGAWSPAFEGQRPPFEPGHELAVKHGAYSSSLAMAPRVGELAAEIREVMPVRSRADEVTVRLLAITLVRIERATSAVDEVDERTSGLTPYMAQSESTFALKALREDLRGWIRLARQLAGDLGMTPLSRARLGLDLAQTQGALAAAERRAELLARGAELIEAAEAEEVDGGD